MIFEQEKTYKTGAFLQDLKMPISHKSAAALPGSHFFFYCSNLHRYEPKDKNKARKGR